MKGHKRILEATNAGHYFSDCGCGQSLGVYQSRSAASAAYAAHIAGVVPTGGVKTILLIGPRAHPATPVHDKQGEKTNG